MNYSTSHPRVLTTREIQDCSLEVMKFVDSFCRENSIKYCLAGGSLIGAIRHHGFIPWDDDLDIQLSRIEYNKLIHSFRDDSGRYKCFAPELGNSFLPFARICDMQKTIAIPYCPWCKETTGIFIDICAEDGVPDSLELHSRKVKELRKQIGTLYQVRGASLGFSSELGFSRSIKLLGKKVLFGRYNLYDLLNNISCGFTEENYMKANYVGVMQNPMYGIREHHRKEIFETYIDVPFEDTSFMVVSEYDELLRNIFGDYMKLPPEEKRVPGHSEQYFIWR